MTGTQLPTSVGSRTTPRSRERPKLGAPSNDVARCGFAPCRIGSPRGVLPDGKAVVEDRKSNGSEAGPVGLAPKGGLKVDSRQNLSHGHVRDTERGIALRTPCFPEDK